MDLSFSSLFVGLIISTIGGGLFMFGKKAQRMPYVLVGLTMCIYPYFISSPLLVIAIAVVLVVPLYTFRHSI